MYSIKNNTSSHGSKEANRNEFYKASSRTESPIYRQEVLHTKKGFTYLNEFEGQHTILSEKYAFMIGPRPSNLFFSFLILNISNIGAFTLIFFKN